MSVTWKPFPSLLPAYKISGSTTLYVLVEPSIVKGIISMIPSVIVSEEGMFIWFGLAAVALSLT